MNHDAERDRELGLHLGITRRDFLQGVALSLGAPLIRAEAATPESAITYYPPTLNGLRGSHAGSFEVAHELRNGRRQPRGTETFERYDLVVVGGGIKPTLLHLLRTPCLANQPERVQNSAGRADIMATSFETYERNLRDQLKRMLGAGGFDPARDITAITVNRRPHGYAHEYNSLFDEYLPEARRPHILGRAVFGNIAIANADAGAAAYTDAAIDQAYRAIQDLNLG
jgi:hypothetical protein